MDYDSLEALVEMLGSQDKQGEQYVVRLTELHPLSHQENGAVNIEATHAALQKIRFFQQFLILPWDADIQENWFEVHLPVRVNM